MARASLLRPRRSLLSIGAALSMLPLAWPGCVQAEERLLRIGTTAAPTSLDPHFHNLVPNNMVAAHVFDALFDLDGQFALKPALAESYRRLDASTWEVSLRRGVVFHDGSAFDANDVLFSLCRIAALSAASPGPFTIYTRSIKYLHAPEPHRLVIRTAEPNSNLPRELALVRIVSDGLIGHQKVFYEDGGCRIQGSWPDRAGFDQGASVIGTGPFKFAGRSPDGGVLLARHEAHWGGAAPWSRVELRGLRSAAARVAALKGGEVDLIESPDTAQIGAIEADPRFSVVRHPASRVIYLVMDQRSEQAPVGVTGTGGRNPFRHPDVRHAVSLAIDREALATQAMDGFARPANQLVAPGLFGHDASAPALRHDLAEARRLMARAGYANGFDMVLRAPDGRYPNDARVANSVGRMLADIGIRARLELLPPAEFFARGPAHDTSMSLWGFGVGTGEASAVLKAVAASRVRDKGWGTANQGRFSQLSLDLAIHEAASTQDDGLRARQLAAAGRRVVEWMAVVPLYHEITPWALRKGLAFQGRADQYTRALDVRPAAAGAER